MAELVDALVSGASAARCRSSNLLSGTKKLKKIDYAQHGI